MKDYNRLTERRDTPLVMSMWAGDGESLKIHNRLAELEDKIESGELISLKKSSEMAREACDILRNIKDDEIKCICEERDALARRAEVAERALKDVTDVLPCSVCPYGYDGLSRQCDLDTGTCLENCLRIAEGKLAEEGRDEISLNQHTT